MTTLPILYSFRRCPYAMRARMAVAVGGVQVELREILLRNKPPEMLEASPKGTVPVLVLPDGKVLEESIDIMRWALVQSDPEGWIGHEDHDSSRPLTGPLNRRWTVTNIHTVMVSPMVWYIAMRRSHI